MIDSPTKNTSPKSTSASGANGSAQAKEGFEKMRAATAEAATVMKNSYSTAVQGAQNYQAKVMEFANSNTESAFEFAQKAISLDNTNEAAYSVLSWLYATKRQFEKAIAESERAISLNPNSAESYMRLGLVLAYAGRAEEGIPYMQNALRLNPFPSPNYFSNLAMIYCESGHYEKAIEAAKRALQSEPNSPIPYTTLAISYIRLGQEEEARAAVAEVRRTNPKSSLDGYAKRAPFTQAQLERNIEDLRKAGLK